MLAIIREGRVTAAYDDGSNDTLTVVYPEENETDWFGIADGDMKDLAPDVVATLDDSEINEEEDDDS